MLLVTVMVIVEAVGVTVCEIAPFIRKDLPAPQFPAKLVTVAVTLFAAVLNTNPDGALKIIVPKPISAVTPSVSTGPVREVNVPPVVSAEIADPPVAVVIVTAAKTVLAIKTAANITKTAANKIKICRTA